MAKENMYLDPKRTVVVSVRGVERSLVTATKKLEERLGRKLTGIDLVDVKSINNKDRVNDETGLFKTIVCDFYNKAELQQVLKPYMDTALLATCRLEDAIKDFQQVITFLPYISTPSDHSLLWSTQKALMRDRLHGYDPNLVPKYVNVSEYDPQSLSDAIDGFTYPLIVKPNGLYSSLLVTRCDDRQTLEACLERTFEVIHEIYADRDGTGTPSVLIEEMMQGAMYSVDAYVGPTGEFWCLPPVEVVTAHSLGLPGGFYAYRYTLPTGLSEDEQAALYETARASVQALALRSTTAHIELYLTPTGWKIIELGPRMGGYRQTFYQEAYGIDHHYNDLLARIGLEPEIPTQVLKHVAGVSIYADQEGIITAIDGLDAARELSSIVSVDTPHAQVGDMALFAENGGELIVDAILSNADHEQLEVDVAKLRELISITVEPKQQYIENVGD